ncbi:MAG: sigma-54 dependent transcriptional regulator [Candidatus Thiodiazotropha sp.]|nr:sigma-54 dependent transcriptional regulator [Candidatus Thiodiazotropha sp.]MCM8921697.1 sigma-54 dependent transcriptional regulator [Candidatus Thiodiazotropha sp.]
MQLNVVDCGFGTIAAEFRQKVGALGRTSLLLKCEDWLQNDQARPTALLVCPQSYPREAVITRLCDCAEQSVLVVLSCEKRGWDDVIAANCSDFVVWPCSVQELELRLQRIMGDTDECLETADSALLPDMIGRSPKFTQALMLLKKMSSSEAPVLVEGETGTGKEMAARALHYLSRRRQHPFIPVNCGALPDELIENELFGHRRGAYTDARDSQPGLVEQAAGGTLFLDEIGTLSLKAQSSLLRFLQNQEFKRLGDDRVQQADIRVVSATNESLEALAECGRFRSDLFYRLNILTLNLPPLRERTGDITLLAKAILERFQSCYGGAKRYFTSSSLDRLNSYQWPGNVREMENLIHREFLLTEGCALEFDFLTSNTTSDAFDQKIGDGGFQHAKASAIAHFERQYLEVLMTRSGGNISLAARLAGKERRSLGRMLKKYGIDKQAFY